MKHVRKFHLVGICLFKSILHLKLKKAQEFSGFFLTFKLKIMIFEVYGT